MPLLYRGKSFESHRELLEHVKSDDNPVCGFRVEASYGPAAHDGLRWERIGALAESDIPPMAPEHALMSLLQCVGTDYVEFADALGVEIEEVHLRIEGKFDLRPSFIPFGLEVPPDVRPGYRELQVHATARTSATKAALEKAHAILWRTNILADTFRAVPVKTEVDAKPLVARRVHQR